MLNHFKLLQQLETDYEKFCDQTGLEKWTHPDCTGLCFLILTLSHILPEGFNSISHLLFHSMGTRPHDDGSHVTGNALGFLYYPLKEIPFSVSFKYAVTFCIQDSKEKHQHKFNLLADSSKFAVVLAVIASSLPQWCAPLTSP